MFDSRNDEEELGRERRIASVAEQIVRRLTRGCQEESGVTVYANLDRVYNDDRFRG
jgi:hypothetical protein